MNPLWEKYRHLFTRLILSLIASVGIYLVVAHAQQSIDLPCEQDLAVTGQYNLIIKDHRDKLEQESARLRYWNLVLTREKKELEEKVSRLEANLVGERNDK